jgi:hypothetical protein
MTRDSFPYIYQIGLHNLHKQSYFIDAKLSNEIGRPSIENSITDFISDVLGELDNQSEQYCCILLMLILLSLSVLNNYVIGCRDKPPHECGVV